MNTTRITTLAAVMSVTALLAAPSWAKVETDMKTDQPAVASKPVKATVKVKSRVKAAKSAAKAEPEISAGRVRLKSAAKNVAAGIEAAETALTPAELAIAERVQVGRLPCELGTSVTLTADTKAPGYFDMRGKNFSYRMFPVLTSTGAIRLEDQKAGAVWLQLANKSMLMNQKQGIRLADECMSPAQLLVAESLKANPPASILDAVKPSRAQQLLGEP